MTPDQVLEVARTGENMGCTEALFSLGDKREPAFSEMRETLRQLGYNSTYHYLEAMSRWCFGKLDCFRIPIPA